MNLKKLIRSTCISLAAVTIFLSCEDNSIEPSNKSENSTLPKKEKFKLNKSSDGNLIIHELGENQIDAEFVKNGYKFEILGEIVNGINTSVLTITELSAEEQIFSNQFDLDISINDYRKFTRNQLLNNANSVLENLNLVYSELELISNLGFDFARELKFSMNSNLWYNEMPQSIFYQSAILKMLSRAVNNSQEVCECSTFDKYLKEESAFICSEDLYYPTSEVEDYFTSLYNIYDSLILDSAGFDTVITFASNNVGSLMSQRQIENIIYSDSVIVQNDTTYSPERLGCWANNGSALGCCGNYPGPCRRCRIICLIHDLVCWSCFNGVICGPDCQPE